MNPTLQRISTPTAMLVALEDRIFEAAMPVLDEAGFKVVRVRHVAAAAERLPVVMPHLVVASTTLASTELDTLGDRCVAIGAELLALSGEVDVRILAPLLASAAERALARRR